MFERSITGTVTWEIDGCEPGTFASGATDITPGSGTFDTATISNVTWDGIAAYVDWTFSQEATAADIGSLFIVDLAPERIPVSIEIVAGAVRATYFPAPTNADPSSYRLGSRQAITFAADAQIAGPTEGSIDAL